MLKKMTLEAYTCLQPNCYLCNPNMKDRISILFLSALLLMAVSYVQVFQKILDDPRFSVQLMVNDDAEENTEKSAEENARETDQDEDPFRLAEIITIHSSNSLVNALNENYSFGHLGYYPEIVSPPPQA
jgi:hypothetical protein